MMSLFRPDRESSVPEFIPLGFDAPEDGFISGSVQSATSRGADLVQGSDAVNAADAESLARDRADEMGKGPEGAEEIFDAPAPGDALHHLSDEQLEEIQAAAYARGEAAAQEEAAAIKLACAAIEKAGVELARTAASQLSANREEMLALAAEMARLWVGAEIRMDSSLFADVIESVLVEIEATEEAQVFLNPEALEVFSTKEESRRASWSEKFGVSLLSDVALEADEYRVETPIQRVDGRTEAVRERLIAALAGAIEAAPPEAEV